MQRPPEPQQHGPAQLRRVRSGDVARLAHGAQRHHDRGGLRRQPIELRSVDAIGLSEPGPHHHGLERLRGRRSHRRQRGRRALRQPCAVGRPREHRERVRLRRAAGGGAVECHAVRPFQPHEHQQSRSAESRRRTRLARRRPRVQPFESSRRCDVQSVARGQPVCGIQRGQPRPHVNRAGLRRSQSTVQAAQRAGR